MKTTLLHPAARCFIPLLSGCVYDDGHGVRQVSVSTGSPYYDEYDEYDEYAPYYSYSGRRYYRDGGRYVCYHPDRRPSYVATLPPAAVYITPSRTVAPTHGPFPHHRRYHHDDD